MSTKFLGIFLCLLFIQTSAAQAEPISNDEFYPNPGIVAYRDGRWVGSDHLYNVSNQIDIEVEIFKSERSVISITEEMIKSRISDIFSNAGIERITEVSPDKPALPVFHMLVMLFPIEKGYVAYCQGRLFEQINLDRIVLDEQTAMQGITWESGNLFLAPSADLTNQLHKSVDEIANTFAERYRFYEDIRTQIQKK